MSTRRYKAPENRHQINLLPPSLDEYVAEGNHVRAIDAYVNSLDLEQQGFLRASGMLKAGQPAYDPRDLLKLFIYGYLNKVRSSRCMERETRRNLELIWLLGQLQPSYKTIADFRKSNAKALAECNKNFILLCRELELFGGDTVGIDGSFFQANASKASVSTEENLKKQLVALEKDIADWQARLAENDHQDDQAGGSSEIEDEALSEKLAALKEKQLAKQEQLAILKKSDQTQLSKTDPDSRLLRKRGQSLNGYNVQIAVDEKHKLLVASDVTNDGNDSHQLAPMSERAKEVLQVESLTVLADAGYYESEQLKLCEEQAITAFVAIPDTTKRFKKDGRYAKESFKYDQENNHYVCPQGLILKQVGQPYRNNNKFYLRYRSRSSDCKNCPMRSQCMTEKGAAREINRWVDEDVLERHQQRMDNSKDKMRLRSALAEHPFGTLKRRAGWDHFLVRGFEKVKGEWGIMALCYNFTRVLNILGMDEFIKYLEERKQSLAA